MTKEELKEHFKNQLLGDISKRKFMLIVDYIGEDECLFDVLMELYLYDDSRVNQRAAYVVGYCFENHPIWVNKYLEKMLNQIEGNVHDALIRNTVRTMQFIDIPENLHSKVLNLCFDYVANPSYAIAIRAFSITVLYNLSTFYPEIKNELLIVLEETIPTGSTGYKNRANKIIFKLKKELNE